MPPDTARQQDAALRRIESRQDKEDQARRSYEADKAKSNGIVQQIAAKGDKPEAQAQVNALTGGKASGAGGDGARGPVGGLSPHKKSANGDLTAAEAAKFGKQLASEAKKSAKPQELKGANDAPAGATDGGKGASGGGGGGGAPEPAPAGDAGGGDGSLGAAAQVTEAPPSVFAAEVGTAGKEITAAAGEELAAASEALPEFTAAMSGEDKQPAAEKVSAVNADRTIPEGGEGPDATAPDLRREPNLKGRKAKPGTDLKGAAAETPPDVLRELFAASLSRIDTSATTNTSPGPSPTVVLSGSSSPQRATDEAGEAVARQDEAYVEHVQAVNDGPGPEAVQPQALEETVEPATFEMPAIPEVPADPAMVEYMSKGHEKAVYDQADALQQPVFDASMNAAQKEFETAVAQRDEAHAAEVDKAQEAIAASNEQAAADQQDAVDAARADIDAGREDTKKKQEDELKKAKKAGDRERRSTEEAIERRRQDDDKKIQSSYKEAEKKAKAEKSKAESKAAAEKSKAEEKQADQSWWDRAASAVGSFLDSVASAVTAIFDTLSQVVGGILNAVKDAAMSVIDAAISFATSALDALGGVLKGLVDSLLGDIFPGLAAALNELIDSAVKLAQDGIAAIGEQLKAAVAAAVDGLNAGINAVINAYKAAVTTALAIASAAVSGDWEGALKAMLAGALSLAGIDAGAFYGLVGQGMDTINAIVDDPGSFVGNMIDAVGQGFSQFAGNFGTHLMNGAISWLTGSLGEAGITLPETWDAGGIFGLVLDVMGLSYDRLRGKVADRIGEENVALLESAWGYVQAAIDGGIEGLWEHAKGQLGDLWQGVLDSALNFLMEKVVTAAVTKIASMFSPVGAIVQALITAWNVYKFVQEQASRIMGLVTSVVESMSQIVAGQLGPAANMIESSLANLVPVAISLLANLLGLGGVSQKVKEIITALQTQVGGAVDWVLDKLVALGQAAFEAVQGALAGGGEEPAGAQAADGQADQGAQEDPAAAAALAATSALQERLPFQAGSEAHQVWVSTEGGGIAVMMASTPTKVSDKVQELRPILAEKPREERQAAGAAIGRVIAIERVLDQMGRDAASGSPADPAAIAAKKAELAAAVAAMLLALPADASRAAFSMEMSLTGENYKTFEKQLGDLYGKMGKSPAAGEAEGIWRMLASALVASTNDFETLRNSATNRIQWDADAAVLDKVLAEFNPLVAALEPAMRAISALSPTWAFWSGDPGKDAAVKNGVNALEASALGAPFDGLDIDGASNMQLWASLSRAYAAYAAEAVDGRTFVGFFGRPPRGDSVVQLIEQPKFRSVTGEQFGATPTITAYAAAAVPFKDGSQPFPTQADVAINAGMKATYGSHPTSAAAGAAAKADNEEREGLYDQLEALVGEAAAQAASRGQRAAGIRAAISAAQGGGSPPGEAGAQAGVQPPPTQGPLPVAPVEGVPVRGGDPAVAQNADAAVRLPEGHGEVQGSAPVQVPVGGNGGPAASVGQRNGVVEGQEGEAGAVQNHPVIPAHPTPAVNAEAANEPPRPKTDPAQLPAVPFKDANDESHTLFIRAEGGRAKVMKASTPTDITNAFDVADKIKADVENWLKLDAGSPEANALLATIQRDMARLLSVMVENRAPTDLAKKRQEFERKLGLHAMTDGAALGSVKELMGKCYTVIEGLAGATRGPEQDVDDRVIELVQDCGKSIDSGFAGAVGKGFADLQLLLLGGGNLREMCLVAYNFQEVIAKVAPKTTPDVIGGILARVQGKEREVELFKQRAAQTKPDDKKNVKTLFSASSEEGNESFSEGQAEFARAKKHDAVTGREMDQKLPDVPLAALPEKTIRDLARQKGVAGWDTKRPEELAAALAAIAGKAMAGGAEGSPLARSSRSRAESGVDLSEREAKATSQQGPDILPFIEGEIANLIDERNGWVKAARALEMPLKAGISGTTQRMMNFGKTMGTSSMPAMRLAMLGFLLPMNAHSFHEIMTSSRGHSGCDYTAGAYSPLPPLGESVLASLAGGREQWEIIKGPTGGGTT